MNGRTGTQWKRPAAVLIPGIAGLVTVGVSWQRWILPFIDGSREMSVPARVASGERLYRDVVYYYGPIGPWLGAIFMKLLGRRWLAIEVLCTIVSVVLFVSMYRCIRNGASRRAAIVAVTAAATICVGAPNGGAFLFPYSVDFLIALSFGFAAIALVGGDRRRSRMLLAAISLAMAVGSRVEVGIPVAFSLLIAGVRWPKRPSDLRSAWTDRRVAVLGLLLGAGAWVVALAGIPLRDLYPEGPGAVFSPPEEWRQVYGFISGLDHPAAGLSRVATGSFLLVVALALCWLLRRRPRAWTMVVALAMGILLTPMGRAADAQWPSIFSAVPMACVVFALVFLWRPWSPAGESGFLLLVLAATIGSRVLLRLSYGQETTPYAIMALPPVLAAAALLLIDSLPALAKRPIGAFRRNVSLLFAGVAAAGFIRTARVSAPSRTVSVRTAIGEVRLPVLEAGPTASTIEFLRREASPRDGLAGFPEAGIFNLVSGLRNPLREEQILPGHLNADSEQRVMDRLIEASPRFIILVGQPSRAFGRTAFGQDYARRLWATVRARYVPRAVFGTDELEPRIGESPFFIEIFELPQTRKRSEPSLRDGRIRNPRRKAPGNREETLAAARSTSRNPSRPE